MSTLGTRIGPYPVGASCPWRIVAPADMTPLARTLEAARTRPQLRARLAAEAVPPSNPEPPTPAPVTFDRAEHCRQIGSLGGQKTVQTYGRRYMAELGKVGFAVYAARHHNGNRAAALGSLRTFTHPDARVRQPGPFRQIKQHAA